MNATHCKRLPIFLFLALLALSRPAHATILTIQQTAQYAWNAGFRGGSLVSAIAAAEAESAYDSDAVNNNLHQTTAGGQLITTTNGRSVLISLPRSNRQMLPLGSIQAVGDGRYGTVVSHCRGLWQFNDLVHSRLPTDTQAFDPAAAAACAWKISRHGRDWGKWVVMQTGTAWEPARLARARAAALAIDATVLTGNLSQRAQARVTGGSIRSTPAGARIRALHAGDTGQLLAGPTKAAITQGPQTSYKLWWQVQWDSGHTGWVSEDLLIRSTTTGLQPAASAYQGSPHNAVGLQTNTAFTWCSGANTASQKLYVGKTPNLGTPDLQFTGLINSWTPTTPLLPYTTYYWRVDTISSQGAVLPGPVWQFLTRPPSPAAVVLESVSTSPVVGQPGFNFLITCQTQSPASQPLLVGVSLHRLNATPVTDLPNEVLRTAPSGRGSFTRLFNLPSATPQGSYTLLIRLAQDYNGNGQIDDFETVITEFRRPFSVAPPGPLVNGLAVSPTRMAPNQNATISASVTALPGSTLTTLKLFRAEGESAPGPYTLLQSINMANTISYNASLTDRPPSIRRYWYALQAFDNTGRGAPDGPYFQPVSTLVTIGDTLPPVLNWNSPVDGASIAPNAFSSGTMTDQDIIESAAYRVDDGSWSPLGTTSWQIYPAANAGPHRLSIRATDRSGNTTEQSRSYYLAPQAGGSDFDEDQNFDGPTDHFPYWQLSLQGSAQITGSRIDAPDLGDNAVFSRPKPPPTWAATLEVSYQCSPVGASLTWDRDFFSPVLVRLVPTGVGQWSLQLGDTATWQSIPLATFDPIANPRLSVLLRISGTQLYSRVVTVSAAPRLLADSLQTMSNLSLLSLKNATFQVGSPDTSPAWLDSISFRALRTGQTFLCRQIRTLPLTTTDRPISLEWTTIPGRSYQLETAITPNGPWTPTGSLQSAAGLLSAQTLQFPRSRPAAFLRVRQMLP